MSTLFHDANGDDWTKKSWAYTDYKDHAILDVHLFLECAITTKAAVILCSSTQEVSTRAIAVLSVIRLSYYFAFYAEIDTVKLRIDARERGGVRIQTNAYSKGAGMLVRWVAVSVIADDTA